MASTQFMSPHCNEAAIIASLQPATPEARAVAGQMMVARRLLLELRQLINPQERWDARDEMAAIRRDPERRLWTVFDSTGLACGFEGGQTVRGGIVGIEATLVHLGGRTTPAQLVLEQKPSMPGKPFMTLRGQSATEPMKTEFDFPARLEDHPLDALVASRGDFAGKPLRYLLNRYHS